MTIPSQDGFEDYRRNRNRRRAREGGVRRPTAPGSLDVVQELEMAEARELQDQQLSREVQEFFVDATQTAASIVKKVTKDQEVSHSAKMKDEMEEFLMSTLHRLERFVAVIRKNTNGREATAELETQMQNIVGPVLDAFRHEGTAQLEDKHIGVDPFARELDEAAASGVTEDPDSVPGTEFEIDGDGSGLDGFRPQAGPVDAAGTGTDATDAADTKEIRRLDDEQGTELEGHILAEMHEEATAARAEPEGDSTQTTQTSAPARSSMPRAADHPMLAALVGEPEKLKKALKLLVQNQLMTRDEALAIWRAEMA